MNEDRGRVYEFERLLDECFRFNHELLSRLATPRAEDFSSDPRAHQKAAHKAMWGKDDTRRAESAN